jgi:hypothetical protein
MARARAGQVLGLYNEWKIWTWIMSECGEEREEGTNGVDDVVS